MSDSNSPAPGIWLSEYPPQPVNEASQTLHLVADPDRDTPPAGHTLHRYRPAHGDGWDYLTGYDQ